MKVTSLRLDGLRVVEPAVFADARGSFLEVWSAERYAALGIDARFVQDNVSVSRKDVVRGMHLQHPAGQAKLVTVLRGAILDVAVDVRVGSPTFGAWEWVQLSSDNHRQLFIPEGFAHGFCALSDEVVVHYKASAAYRPSDELGVAWDDPDLAIPWPCANPIVSPKDRALPRLRDIDSHTLPRR